MNTSSKTVKTFVNVNTSVLVFGLVGYTLTITHNIMILLSYGLLNSLMFNLLYLTVMASTGVMIILPSFYDQNILLALQDYIKSKDNMCKIVDSPSHEEVLVNEVEDSSSHTEMLNRLNSLRTTFHEFDKNMNSSVGDILECMNTLELRIISIERKLKEQESSDTNKEDDKDKNDNIEYSTFNKADPSIILDEYTS